MKINYLQYWPMGTQRRKLALDLCGERRSGVVGGGGGRNSRSVNARMDEQSIRENNIWAMCRGRLVQSIKEAIGILQ